MSDNNEQERLKQLRDKQIAARDPLVKERQFQRNTAVKEKRMKKSFSLVEEWRGIPHVIKAPLYGLLLGAALVFILPKFWVSQWALIAAGGATLFFIIFGLVVGSSLDLRDKIRDHVKK